MSKYERVSLDVLHEQENNRYFSRVSSAKGVRRKFFDEETLYSISSCDIEIKIGNGCIVDAILLSFCRENIDEESGKVIETSFLEMIISEMLGTFTSDWF